VAALAKAGHGLTSKPFFLETIDQNSVKTLQVIAGELIPFLDT
jgi:hypothetical protein